MLAILIRVLFALRSVSEPRASREAEILVLRQQLLVLSRKSGKRVRLRNIDRLVLVCLYRLFPSLLDAIIIVNAGDAAAPGIDEASALTGAGSLGGVAAGPGSIANSGH